MAPMVAPLIMRQGAAQRLSMASSLLRTSIRPPSSMYLRRGLATEADAQDSRPQSRASTTTPATNAFTVEELHDKSAEEILREGGSRKEASMRHFTVNFG